MNKLVLRIFSVLFPFYPLLAYALHFVTDKPFNFIVNIALIPVAIICLGKARKGLPMYVLFFFLFTVFHLVSSFINNTIPADTNRIYYIFADENLLACTFFVIVESTVFPEKFMDRLTKNIFIIVVITLIVSVIQIKAPTFMFNTKLLEGDQLEFWGDEIRNNSIYSFITTNSIGITFPFLVAILLNYYSTKQIQFPIIILSGIIVAFLSKSRYVMISAIIAISQLFFTSSRTFANKLSMLVIFASCIYLAILGAEESGFDLNKIIEERILEKDTDLGSAKSRVLSYDVFLMKYPEHPWLGVGPKTRPDVITLLQGETPVIHVGYLCYLYYYGAVGCFFLFTAIGLMLKRAWTVGKKFSFWGAFFGLVAMCMANFTLVYFAFAEMGVVVAMIYLRYYKLQEESEKTTIRAV
ncbi:MAG TPA: O-antigen ligase family protein [Chitinophagaceae bacterium]|nr:O-antigen ligase family protein [Chitinophagaceae bacterium]